MHNWWLVQTVLEGWHLKYLQVHRTSQFLNFSDPTPKFSRCGLWVAFSWWLIDKIQYKYITLWWKGKNDFWYFLFSRPIILTHPKCYTPIRQISFTRDGNTMLAVSDNATIWRWDRVKWTESLQWPMTNMYQTLTWSKSQVITKGRYADIEALKIWLKRTL